MDATGKQLIFLISLPRSGSTLLQHILGSHSRIHTLPEPWFMLHLVYGLREKGLRAEYNSAGTYEGLREFLGALPGGESNYDEAVRAMASVLYGKALEASGRKYFLDKTPRYYLIIPELRRIFPGARFVLLVRNPLAVLSSILEVNLEGNWIRLFSDERRNDILRAPGLLLDGIRTPGPGTCVVRYEDLVHDPEKTVERICGDLEIPFEPAMLNYADKVRFEGSRGVDPKSIYRHGGPVTDYADAWPEKLDTPEKSQIARGYLEFLGPKMMEALGYSYQETEKRIKPAKTSRWLEAALHRLMEVRIADMGRVERLRLYLISSLQSRGFRGTVRRGLEFIGRG